MGIMGVPRRNASAISNDSSSSLVPTSEMASIIGKPRVMSCGRNKGDNSGLVGCSRQYSLYSMSHVL